MWTSTLVDIRTRILPVWVGHSCPTPLTLIFVLILILTLTLTLLLRPLRTHAAPWKSGASAPRAVLDHCGLQPPWSHFVRIYLLTAFLEPRRDSWTNRSTSPSRRPCSSAR